MNQWRMMRRILLEHCLACKVFEDALYRWAKILKDAGKPLPMANDKCQYHVVSVIYAMLNRFQCKCHVIHHTTFQVFTRLIPLLEPILKVFSGIMEAEGDSRDK